ncbi:hypothetical protein K2173_015969 [Erythroxylum novogranatense]|uniref:CASP-like protein n=1 Tax=Erythroxylum novogranatense TaxID=1862640 RepID=A0AAV8SFG3_9ROSI|nr:hypothetical protein K2173_015969 [Erythroxylum novogranatense]
MELGTPKVEAFLRLCSILLLVLTACLVGLDSQKKFIFYLEREVKYKYLKALIALVYVDSAVAVYNLLQLGKFLSFDPSKGNFKGSYLFVAWSCCLLDQLAVYVTFATATAALEHSVLVLQGAKVFQWMTWCSKFTGFCTQIGIGLFCGYAATILLAFISFISAFNLFRLYSPERFLLQKPT